MAHPKQEKAKQPSPLLDIFPSQFSTQRK